jgi:cytidylate kinase
MNKNEKFVITINRELGSGGRTVGSILAKKLGVPFYDKALIRALEEKYNLSVEEIERMKGKSHTWWDDFERIVSVGHGLSFDIDMGKAKEESEKLTTEKIFRAEKEIIEGIADAHSCVIAGRLAFFVLRDHPNHLRIFIQAPMKYRLERIMNKKGLSEKEARNIIKEVDEMRKAYVKKFANTSRYDTRNYDLVINVEGKTEEEVADQILSFIG